jgi:hypothetical protein
MSIDISHQAHLLATLNEVALVDTDLVDPNEMAGVRLLQ